MRKFLKNKPLLIAIAALLVLAVLAVATAGERSLTWIESTVSSVAQPVQSFAANVSNGIIDFVENLFNTTDADQENEQLKIRIAQLEQMLSQYEQVKSENERLKELVNYSEMDSEWEVVTCRVIGRSQGIWFDVFTVNAGRNHGIEKDMPVVNSSGLVGRVTDVGATSCKITAIVDARMSASVMVERTRDVCMIRGTMEAGNNRNELELYYLPSGSDLVPGDKIITNGLGGIYPRGITVGTVTEVTRQSTGNDTNAIVAPAVDFLRVEEVMIITSTAAAGEEDAS